MYKINNIEIYNFKSIKHQRIDGCNKINLFIGYPNVGKSNVLEALGLYSLPAFETLNLKDAVRIDNIPNLFFNGNVENSIQVVINESVDLDIRYSRTGGLNLICRDVTLTNEDEYFKYHIKNDLTFKKETRQLVPLYSHNYFGPIFKYNFNTISTGKIQNGSIYNKLSVPNGSNLYSFINYNEELKSEVKDLLERFQLSLVFDQATQSMKVLKKINEENLFIVPFDLIADTLQRLIFYKAAIISNENSVLLFEEPEAHMFPPYIKKLTTDILLDESNQFFIATHSPYVLNEFIENSGDDLSVYLVDYKNGETVIKLLSKEKLNEVREFGVDLFFNLEDYLNDRQINPD